MGVSLRLIVTYGFPWAEETISDKLSTGRGDGETESLVLLGVLTSGGLVDILEDLVETELSETLSGVSNEGWCPSLKNKEIMIR